MASRLLVTGGSGYLGRHLSVAAASKFDLHTTYASHPQLIKAGTPHQLDLTNRNAVLGLITTLFPEAIIHTAASNPGQDETVMMEINQDGSHHMAEGARAVGARLVHVSTDLVHDGEHSPYSDEAPPNPITWYGKTKTAAEATVSEVDPDAAIVRTSLIYGLLEMDRGTASFVKRLKEGQHLSLFRDQIRQPIWVETLVSALLKLATKQTDIAGPINIVGGQVLSREAFAMRMLAWWGIETEGRLRSTLAASLTNPVPLDLRLITTRARQLLAMSFPGVDEVLAIVDKQNR